MTHHATVFAPQPSHQHLLRNAGIGGSGTEVVTEGVKTAARETLFPGRVGESRLQGCDHFADQICADSIGLQDTAVGAMKNPTVRMPGDDLDSPPKFRVQWN